MKFVGCWQSVWQTLLFADLCYDSEQPGSPRYQQKNAGFHVLSLWGSGVYYTFGDKPYRACSHSHVYLGKEKASVGNHSLYSALCRPVCLQNESCEASCLKSLKPNKLHKTRLWVGAESKRALFFHPYRGPKLLNWLFTISLGRHNGI